MGRHCLDLSLEVPCAYSRLQSRAEKSNGLQDRDAIQRDLWAETSRDQHEQLVQRRQCETCDQRGDHVHHMLQGQHEQHEQYGQHEENEQNEQLHQPTQHEQRGRSGQHDSNETRAM